VKTFKFKCILLIDDDDINNFLNSKVIELLKITDRILVARNGKHALEVLRHYLEENNELPELIFVDINMPVMDGLEFTEKLLESGLTLENKTTLVPLTSSTSHKDRDRFKELGVHHYLIKPLTTLMVLELLNRIFKKPITNTFAIPIIPPDEAQRLKAVKKYKILDTDPEQSFNTIVEEAARFFNVPIAGVSIVDEERVFFKANVGMEGFNNVDRGMSLCSLAILKDELTYFNDASEDPCLLSNPIVHGPFGLRFYAGAPIIDADGFHIGTVCVVDKNPREFSEGDKQKLSQFASLAMEKIEQRLKLLIDKK
jgi:CheY-like chemotaxis protein